MVDSPFAEISINVEDILHCSYSHWYPKFEKYTLSEAVIYKSLPKSFVEYLESDDIELPKENKKDSVIFQDAKPTSDNEYSDWEDDRNEEIISADKFTKSDPTKNFKELHEQLKETINRFGSVAPKLNWSAPQDSTWIMTGRNMRCYSTTDLFLLLKSSDYLNHDIYHAFDEAKDYDKNNPPIFDLNLILRKWVDINPSMEFRCFVRDRQLIAISQRDLNYYSFLDELKDELTEKIGIFFDDVLMGNFDCNSFVFDVYLPKPFNEVYLIDINPYQRSTESLLFTWNELITMDLMEEYVEFRLVTQHNSGRFATKAHSQNHVPRDFLDASVDTQSMVDFLKKCKELELNERDTSDSGSDDDGDIK
ncbi:hypothetical protein C6P40_004747 [Pichia californica]|uniref:Translation initiation factor eIF2 assembly protein n=1 Tax=Pichia californica TaxID=460514 RepID=A0A9P7BHC5_9ASCO|nr:hypothetical protein C6P40_004747 [[Candida] californica]